LLAQAVDLVLTRAAKAKAGKSIQSNSRQQS